MSSDIFGNSGLVGNGFNGIDGNLIQQWNMLRANSSAYKKLLQAQQTGSVKQGSNYTDLMSDKYFNDNFDNKTGALIKPTYTATNGGVPTIDADAEPTDTLGSMRNIALAALAKPDSLNDIHYDLFEQMRQSIANGLVTQSGSGTTATTTKDAAAASLSRNTGFRLLTDDQTFAVAGKQGEKTYTFTAGQSLSEIAAAINADSAETGVRAETLEDDAGTIVGIKLDSTGTGKESFVRVDQIQGDLFASAGASASAVGADATTEEVEEVANGDDAKAAMAVGIATGALFEDQTFTISGVNGSREFSFAAGTSIETIAQAINEAELGITAEVIRGAGGTGEGLGLSTDKGGSGQFIKVEQNAGDLFASAGKTVKVMGKTDGNTGDGTTVNSLSDFGRIDWNGQTYSFADLGPGGSASLANNPDAALAVIDQALRQIYSGEAKIKDFDPTGLLPSYDLGDSQNSSNAMEIGNYGSDAIAKWVNGYAK